MQTNPRDFNFKLLRSSTDGPARAGIITTAHSEILTPVFMPVGTHAVVRGQDSSELAQIGFQIILGNTYHLLIRPGPEIFKQFGGIHRFMNWPRSVLTDSGGYQIFSMPNSLKITEQGAEFKSYLNGDKILLSPETSIQTQRAINSDIMMVLDQCVPSTSERSVVKQALELTERWARRSLQARGDSRQALFGIVQGGCFPDLRRESAAQITALPFDGFALGGLAVGENLEVRNQVVALAAELLPRDKPRYLMGVGTPLDLLESVARGIDMFDCIIPTALAQQGLCFSSQGKFSLRRGVYKNSEEALDKECSCVTCLNYSRAYLHHLVKVGEFQGHTLIGIHNLTFYYNLMRQIRESILEDRFAQFYREVRDKLAQGDPENPTKPPEKKSRL